MEKLFAEIEMFMARLDEQKSSEQAREAAVKAHQVIDIAVRKMQILKDYLEILGDECILYSDGSNPLPGIFEGLSEVRRFMDKIRLIESEMSTGTHPSNIADTEKLRVISENLGQKIERLFQLGFTFHKAPWQLKPAPNEDIHQYPLVT